MTTKIFPLSKIYFAGGLTVNFSAGPAEQLTVNPPAKYILERGNILVVMGKTADLQKLPQD